MRAVLVCGLLCASASAHPNHVSYGEVDWNAEDCKLEISIQVHTADLEKALAGKGKPVDLTKRTKAINTKIAKYLKAKFLATAQKKSLPQTFVGYEVNPRATWVYLEVSLAKPADVILENRLFFGMLEEQKNSMTIRVAKKKTVLLWTEKTPRHTISLRKDAKNDDGK